jgi:Ca-activated chloride channel family protein
VSPLLIVVLVVVGLVVVAYLFGRGPEPTRGRRQPAMLRRRSRWRRWLPVLPLLAAVGCLVLAFMGFDFRLQKTSPTIVLAIDVSDSMEATDVAPNRLVAAENAASTFLDQLPEDFRVGLVTFAGDARALVQPTDDRASVEDALASFTTSNGTVIGDGLALALREIREEQAGADTPAAVLLLSDGRDTGSDVSPARAAVRARSMGIPVFTVVLGEEEGKGGANIGTLRDIADTSGGEVFLVATSSELTRVYADIGSQLSVDLDVQSFSTPLVIAAIALAVLAGFMLILAPR